MIETAEEFVRLRASEILEEYNRAAHDHAPEAVWLDVIHRFLEMRFWVAHNKSVPISILRTLAADADEEVRCMVAAKRKLPLDMFERLADDPSPSVRQRLAYNAKLPDEIRERLARDADPIVAAAALRRI